MNTFLSFPYPEKEDSEKDICQHKFVQGKVRIRIGDPSECEAFQSRGLPDNKPVFYYESYFCEKCLFKYYEQMDLVLDVYAAIRYDALPLPEGAYVK